MQAVRCHSIMRTKNSLPINLFCLILGVRFQLALRELIAIGQYWVPFLWMVYNAHCKQAKMLVSWIFVKAELLAESSIFPGLFFAVWQRKLTLGRRQAIACLSVGDDGLSSVADRSGIIWSDRAGAKTWMMLLQDPNSAKRTLENGVPWPYARSNGVQCNKLALIMCRWCWPAHTPLVIKLGFFNIIALYASQ